MVDKDKNPKLWGTATRVSGSNEEDNSVLSNAVV